MKRIKKVIFISTLLIGLGAGLCSCVGYVDGPGYYGQDHWYHDGPWMGGPRGFVGVSVFPGRR